MPIMLGGERAWKQRVMKDVVLSYHWVNGEPALCLWPMRPRVVGSRGSFIICLSAAHKYAHSNGDPDLHYLIPQAIRAARVMGMDEGRFTVRNIADAILEGIPDLVRMPPEPTLKQMRVERPVGEITIVADGKKVHEAEVSAPTPEEMLKVNDDGD